MTENLEKVYKDAVYRVLRKGKEISFKIGEDSAETDAILNAENAETFAFITAYNPHSKQLLPEENKRRQKELIKVLCAKKLKFLKGYGTNEDESWQREESVFVLNISEEEAVNISRRFEQNAIVFGKKNNCARLVWCK